MGIGKCRRDVGISIGFTREVGEEWGSGGGGGSKKKMVGVFRTESSEFFVFFPPKLFFLFSFSFMFVTI